MTPPVPQVEMAPRGPSVSRLVAGMMNLASWQLTLTERIDWLNAVLDMGITTFDHADIYGSYTCEAVFGEALAADPSLRQRMQLITKCGIKLLSENRPEHTVHAYDTSKAHILSSVNHSLRQLQTDYIDLMLIHRPDPLMNADAVAEAFVELKQSGKVLNFGVSNFTPFQFDLLASRLDFPLVTNQVELSVVALDVLHDGTLDQCQQRRIRPMAWAPFGGGRLFTAVTDQAFRLQTSMQRIGESLGGASMDQIALAWILQHPSGVLPILGTGKLSRLQSAARSLEIVLTRDQWFAIWEASTGHEVP